MGVDVVGTDLRAFEQISNGKYNLGSVVLADEGDPRGGLAKVNNHKHFGSNSQEISEFCNHKVRVALYNAIRSDRNGSALGADVLAAIRAQLGLGVDGQIDTNSRIGDKDLSRREIKQIISFVKEATAKKSIFETTLYAELKAAVDRTALSTFAKFALEAVLLGPNGQLRKLEDAALMSLVGRLRTALVKPGAATADELKGRAAEGVQAARQALLKFVAAFTSYATVAEQTVAVAPDAEKALKQTIAQLRQEVGALAANERERATLERKLGELTTLAHNFSHSVSIDLNAHLFTLKLTDLPDQADTGTLASKYVNGKMQALLAASATRLASIKETIASVKTRLAEEAQQLEAANRQKLDAARGVMTESFNGLDKDLGDLDAFAEQLKTLAGDQTHARTEERLDGDRIAATQKQVADLLAAARQKQKQLLAQREEKDAALVPGTAAETAAELKQACATLVAETKKGLADLIATLNTQLAYTVVAAPGGDAEAAARATADKRAALTQKLEGAWDSAEKAFDAAAASLTQMLETSSCDSLSTAEKDEVRELLAHLKDRFGAENRKIYVQNHPADGAEPKDILAKATADAMQLSSNVLARNVANGHVALQEQLDRVGRWTRREPDAVRTIWADFQKLSGFSLAGLGGSEDKLRSALLPVLLRLIDDQRMSFNALAADVRGLAEQPTQRQARVLDCATRFREMIQAISAKLADPEVVARAMKTEQTFAEVAVGILAVKDELLTQFAADAPIVKFVRADADALIEGYQHHLSRLCLEPQEGFDAAQFLKDLQASYRELETKRARLNGYLRDLAGQNANVSVKLAETTNPTEITALEANGTRIKKLHRQLEMEAAKFGKENALSLAQLEAMMQKSGFFGGKSFQVDAAEKVLAGPREAMSLAEQLIQATGSDEIAFDLGPAPARPAFNAGLNDNLVAVPPEVRQPLPALDRIINANH